MKGAQFIFATTLIVLVFAPVLSLGLFQSFKVTIATIPVSMIVLYSAVHLATIARMETKLPITTTFWVFVYVFMGFIALFQISTGIFPRRIPFDESFYSHAGLLILIGLFAFDFGYALSRPRTVPRAPSVLGKPVRKPTVIILAIIFTLVTIFLIPKLGGVKTLLLPRSQHFAALSEDFDLAEHLVLQRLLSTPLFILTIATLVVWVSSKRLGRSVGIGWKLLFFGLLLFTLLLNNPISTPRFKVGTILLSIWFALPWRRWSNLVTISGIIGGIVTVFPLVAIFRHKIVDVFETAAQFDSVRALVSSGDFSAFQVVATVQHIVGKTGYQMGQQMIGAFLFWVPRSLWPSKPISTSSWASAHSGYNNPGISSPLWAEFFVDGGWLLLIVGFIAYGYLVRKVDRLYVANYLSAEPRIISVLVPVYAGMQILFLRGSLTTAVSNFAPMLLVLFLCALYTRVGRNNRRIMWQTT